MTRFSNPHTIQIPERKQTFHQCALLSQMSFWNLFRQKKPPSRPHAKLAQVRREGEEDKKIGEDC